MRSLSLEGLGQELRAAFLDVDGETQRELKFKEQRQKRSEEWRDRGNPWRVFEDLGGFVDVDWLIVVGIG